MADTRWDLWQGTVERGVELVAANCPEVLPWADPYIAALVERHRMQAAFSSNADGEDADLFENADLDESLDDFIPPPAGVRAKSRSLEGGRSCCAWRRG
jgi:hypothetical protein